MARDNHPRTRQLAKLARKSAKKASYDRVLIVTEGEKTEPHYLSEIRISLKLHTASVHVYPSRLGTSPLQVVEYAKSLFENGDPHKELVAKRWDRVYAVFDRDDHQSYHNALMRASALNGNMRNDIKSAVVFEAIPSVQSFELWLLGHFEDIAPDHLMHRNEVIGRLKTYLPDYEKGSSGIFTATQPYLHRAFQNAARLRAANSPHNGTQPYTDMDKLVQLLLGFRNP